MALIEHFDLELHHIDIKITLLNSQLFEELYMFQPEGFEIKSKEHMVCKLRKPLHGLK